MANWQGPTNFATKKQLVSSISGLYDDLQDIELSSIKIADLTVSTITVAQWLSSVYINVSTLHADNLDVSGIVFDASGIFFAPTVSSSTAEFNIALLSSLQFKFDPTLNVDVHVGEAFSGFLLGLGGLLFQTLLGVGVGAGAAFQGIGNGLASMIWGRGGNASGGNTFINNQVFEILSGTTQFQVSTLGSAYPIYSTIFRSVSSIAPDSVPGQEVFLSSFFYPGQICIRSISDPFPMVTTNSNINTSTIQSFGQWVPLEGLEPENIVANSISTNSISSGTISTGSIVSLFGSIETLESYSLAASNLGIGQTGFVNYQAPLEFQTGTTNAAAFKGDLNRLYCYNTTGWIFSQGGTTEMGSLYVGSNANQSLMNVSSIYSQGEMKTVNFYASTITAESITAVSTLFITSTNLEVVTTTSTLNADNAFINKASISTLDSFRFDTGVGNPFGIYDIAKTGIYPSTTYDQISSLTHNILNYTLIAGIQEETSFNMGGQGAGTPRAYYSPRPANIEQWASTMIICNPTNGLAATLDLGNVGTWTSTPLLNATFDLKVDQTAKPFNFTAIQNTNQFNPLLPSTFIQLSPTTGFTGTYRFSLQSNGWWTFVSPAPPPYETFNNHVFTITQDINDVNLNTTDRFNVNAGDIFLNGNTHLQNLQINQLEPEYIITNFLSTISTAAFGSDSFFKGQVNGNLASFSNITLRNIDTTGTVELLNLFNSPVLLPSSLLSTPSNSYTFLESVVSTISVNPPISLFPANPTDTITLSKLGLWLFSGVNQSQNYYGTTFNIAAASPLFRVFTDNNGFGLASNLQVANISNVGTNGFSLFINFPSAAINIPAGTGVSIFWNATGNTFVSQPFTPFPPFTNSSRIAMGQDFSGFVIQSENPINISTSLIKTQSIEVNQINYGSPTTGYLQPKMFRQIFSASFGGGQSDSGNVQITNGSMVFSGSLYHCQVSIASFTCANAAVAFNEVILAPYVDSGTNTWYVSYNTAVNAVANSYIISWNAFMFPNNMSSP
jgi:hypothetical protein